MMWKSLQISSYKILFTDAYMPKILIHGARSGLMVTRKPYILGLNKLHARNVLGDRKGVLISEVSSFQGSLLLYVP
jgi:hypothetical protein